MSIRIGINGFGRIGKLVFKLASTTPGIEVAHINDYIIDTKILSHLLKYDSIHGKFAADVSFDTEHLIVDGSKIPVTHFSKPSDIPWSKNSVDIVLESSGKFKTREMLQGHIDGGAKKVILSSPSKDRSIDRTVVMGVNHTDITSSDRIISNASCTTNCVAIMIKVMDEAFGIKKALMNTIHPFTNNQNLQDGYHSDPRRARSALNNIIPTTTSAIDAIKIIFPRLADSFDGFATRVPVADCSFVELYMHLDKVVTEAEINRAFLDYANSTLKQYLEYCSDPIVSSDVNDNTHSAVFDALSTKIVGGDLVQILAWYDNEMGYSARVIDLIKYISEH